MPNGSCCWGGGIYLTTPEQVRFEHACADHLQKVCARCASPPFPASAKELYERVLARSDEHLDLISGAAGCLLVALHLHQVTRSPRAMSLAATCAKRLAAQARCADGAASWPNRLGTQPLLGFSHGVGGIAVALASYAVNSGDERALALSNQALAYERRRYAAGERNWPDLRGDASAFRWAWCHGAPGIGISRVLLRRLAMGDVQLEGEIENAWASTVERGFGGSHSLCHGDLGNADLLLLAGEQHHGLARRFARAVLAEQERSHRWRCGLADWQETPGLMVGIAGIGYGLLRVLDPTTVPSVLALEPPRAGRGA